MSSLGIEVGSQVLQWERQFEEEHNVPNLRPRDNQFDTIQRLRRDLRENRTKLDRTRYEYECLRKEYEELLVSKLEKDDDESSKRSTADDPDAIVTEVVECNNNNNNKTSLKFAAFMLPRYDGTDPTDYAAIWLKKITDTAATFSWSDEETFKAAKQALEGSARSWLIGRRREVTDWAKFKAAFAEQYHRDRTSITRKHLELAKRRMTSIDNPLRYAMDIEKLGCKLDLAPEDIVEYIMLGLDEETKISAKLKDVHKSEIALGELKRKLKRLNELSVAESDGSKVAKKTVNKQCYNCNEWGHVYADCKEYVEYGVLKYFAVIMVFLFFAA